MAKKIAGYDFDGIESTLRELAGLNSTIATITAKKKQIEADLIQKAGMKYWAQKAGSLFQKTINLVNSVRRVAVTWADSFGTANEDQVAELKEALGERFDEVFEPSVSVKLKDVNLEVIRTLVTPEIFDRLFEVETKWKPQKNMDQLQFSLTPEQRAALEAQQVVQRSPTVKLYDLKAGERDKYSITNLTLGLELPPRKPH